MSNEKELIRQHKRIAMGEKLNGQSLGGSAPKPAPKKSK